MKYAFLALALVFTSPAFAQGGVAPKGDWALYLNDRPRWQAQEDARAIAREEIAREHERERAEAADAAEMERRHCAPVDGNPTLMTCDPAAGGR